MKALRRIILSVSGLLILVSQAWLWLMHTTSGARLVINRAASATGLEVAAVDGSIARGLELQGVRYDSGGVQANIATLSAVFDVSVMPTEIDILGARLHGVRVAVAPAGRCHPESWYLQLRIRARPWPHRYPCRLASPGRRRTRNQASCG